MISPYYDPMIAKLIVHGARPRRGDRRLARTLEPSFEVWPVKTNARLPRPRSASRRFRAGDVDTGFIRPARRAR